jgi:tetratricopeptide (TPR) repeat protein
MRPWAGTSDEAIVYATVRTNGEVGERMRFWLRKKSGQWRIYDQEDLRYGMRGSTMGGGVLRKDLVNNSAAMKRISASMKTIKTGKQQLENEQYDNAAKSFAAAADPALPKPSEALRLTLLATAKVRQDKFNDALDLTRQAAQINPDIPLADLVKARAHNGLDEPDKALSALDRYDAAVGADFLSSAARGDALLFNGKREEALKCYRRGLDDEPDSPENFIGLCRLLGTDGIAELRTRIAKVPDVSILLDKVANDALGEHRVNQLEVAATLYRDAGKIDTDPMAAYTEAEVFAMKHQWAEAVKAFNRRLDLLHSSNRTRGPTDRELAIAMIHSKQVLEGYNLHTNKRAAMVIAGDELISAGDADTLTKLIARHKANDPQDALRLHYYSGELAELRNQLADAEKEYRAALPLAGADDWRVPIHHALVRVLFNSDRVAEAYNTIGPRKETLAELIRLAHSNKRPQALRQIADLVEAETPTDLIVIKYRADAAWMEKDYARCAQILLPRAREMCDRKDLAWQVRNPLVRSLLKTNRAAEAFAFARDTTNTNWHSDYLLALSATAAGDVSTAIPQLDKVMAPPDDDEDRTTVEDLLADEDFATALKSPKFAPWLRKHQAAGPSSPATRPSSVRPANP